MQFPCLGRNSIAIPSFRIIPRTILRIAIELNQFQKRFWEWFWDWNLGHTAERTCTNYQFENHSQTEHFGMILRIILRSLVVNSITILRIILRIILKLGIAIELCPRISLRTWRETKQQLSWWLNLVLLGCCLVSLHYLCQILNMSPICLWYLISKFKI